MFIKSSIESKLDAEIESALDQLSSLDKSADDYSDLVELISKLHKLKTEERPKRVSPDAVLGAAANVFGILWLTRYEKTDVINSKALGFVKKPW